VMEHVEGKTMPLKPNSKSVRNSKISGKD
jgi:hypothetical protein